MTTRVGNMPELVKPGENGMFIDRSVPSLVRALATLRDNRALLLSMKRRARERVLEWCWKRQAERFAHMIGEVL